MFSADRINLIAAKSTTERMIGKKMRKSKLSKVVNDDNKINLDDL